MIVRGTEHYRRTMVAMQTKLKQFDPRTAEMWRYEYCETQLQSPDRKDAVGSPCE